MYTNTSSMTWKVWLTREEKIRWTLVHYKRLLAHGGLAVAVISQSDIERMDLMRFSSLKWSLINNKLSENCGLILDLVLWTASSYCNTLRITYLTNNRKKKKHWGACFKFYFLADHWGFRRPYQSPLEKKAQLKETLKQNSLLRHADHHWPLIKWPMLFLKSVIHSASKL